MELDWENKVFLGLLSSFSLCSLVFILMNFQWPFWQRSNAPLLPEQLACALLLVFGLTVKKIKKEFSTIDEYIASFPKEIQEILASIRKTIKSSAPNAIETISYQMPAFRLNGILVYFAVYKNHIGFYPTPSAITEFSKELSNYEFSKGAIKFPLNEPIPLELIKKIVEFRVKENTDKA
jgi:uncharacterized protein YdhG (YjbR/CyaY superfamily)